MNSPEHRVRDFQKPCLSRDDGLFAGAQSGESSAPAEPAGGSSRCEALAEAHALESSSSRDATTHTRDARGTRHAAPPRGPGSAPVPGAGRGVSPRRTFVVGASLPEHCTWRSSRASQRGRDSRRATRTTEVRCGGDAATNARDGRAPRNSDAARRARP